MKGQAGEMEHKITDLEMTNKLIFHIDQEVTKSLKWKNHYRFLDCYKTELNYSYLNDGSVPVIFMAAVILQSSAIRLLYPASLSYQA